MAKIFRAFVFGVLALSVSACVGLTSTHPLFSADDRGAPTPIAGGTWVAVGDDCPREALSRRTLPRKCEPFQLAPSPDGAWIATGIDERSKAGKAMRFLIAPATENVPVDTYAPLYIIQYQNDDAETPTWSYMVVAPIGAMPAHEVFVVPQIDCDAVLRQGPIEGVSTERDADGKITSCAATTQAAVREAARRAIIEALPTADETRLVRLDR